MHFYVCLYVCINIHMYAYLDNDSCLLHPLVALLKKVMEYMEPINPHGFLAPFAPIVPIAQYDRQTSVDFSVLVSSRL